MTETERTSDHAVTAIADRPEWDLDAVQRVLYHVVRRYQQANEPEYLHHENNTSRVKKMPRRFILFGPRLPFLGGDSELLRSAIYDVAIPTLKNNGHWPFEDEDNGSSPRADQ